MKNVTVQFQNIQGVKMKTAIEWLGTLRSREFVECLDMSVRGFFFVDEHNSVYTPAFAGVSLAAGNWKNKLRPIT